jgi:hypothetical protein
MLHLGPIENRRKFPVGDGKHDGTRSSDDRNAGRHAEIMRKVPTYVKGYKVWTKTSPGCARCTSANGTWIHRYTQVSP